ncbi:MAG: hypothetical protein L6U16_09910 [Porphyromonadaceae bacterium]|nr:MAG: hypothetical protein L6U16_09910 [Porphyromonadaceae bacterium]
MSLASNEATVYRGAKNQMLMTLDVLTEGGKNAFNVDELKIATSALSGTNQVSNVRLYNGTKITADGALATAPALGDELVATNVALKSGHNIFSVVADILPDAKGSIPGISVTSIKVNGAAQTLENSTSAPVAVSNDILMTADHTTFTISDDANFYDDGGKDGKISEKFNGTITFVPATAGQKIKVDFSKLAIFNTSSVGYNDVFKFYNGRTADDTNLITTLLKEAKVVKSSADDGSMTITLSEHHWRASRRLGSGGIAIPARQHGIQERERNCRKHRNRDCGRKSRANAYRGRADRQPKQPSIGNQLQPHFKRCEKHREGECLQSWRQH